jgi:hypothetical protein
MRLRMHLMVSRSQESGVHPRGRAPKPGIDAKLTIIMNTPSALPQKRPAWKIPVLILCILLVLIVAAAATALWWWSRPIQATVLSPAEQVRLEQKLDAVAQGPAEASPAEAPYEPGGKVIILTEREINGLLAMNGLGDQLHIDLARDAVHARVRTDLDPDLPVVGGKTLRAKARFLVQDDKGLPAIILDDFTLWGISLPNAWLAGMKGQNLIEAAAAEIGHNAIADGIDQFTISPGQITITLAD